MAISDLFGGGILTFGIVLLAVFLLYLLWRVLIAPILALFGIGAKSMSRFSERGISNWGNAWSRERNIQEREQKESAEEGRAKRNAQQSKNINENERILLQDSASTQNFSEEKVRAMNSFLKEQEEIILEEEKMFDSLSKEYKLDRKETRRMLDDIKAIIRMQRDIEQQALANARAIEKYGRRDDHYGRIIAIVEEMKSFEVQIQGLEARDVEVARQLEDVTEQRSDLIKEIKHSLDDSHAAMKKEPILSQLPNLQANQQKREENMNKLIVAIESAGEILQEHKRIGQAMQGMYGKITPLLEEQQKHILESTAHLRMLAEQGAIPKKLAA